MAKASDFEALPPAEIFAKAIAVGGAKASMPLVRQIALSIAAGLFIGMGGMFMLVVKADSELSFGISALLGGLAFSLGLFSVLVAGAELFTGNNLMVLGMLDGRYGVGALLRSWLVVYLGNFAGAIILALLLRAGGFDMLGSGALGSAAAAVASAKCALAPGVAFFRGVLCNILVCLAVWLGFAGRTVVDKFLAAALPVTAFVACGFEHCIANMFFLPFGAMLGAEGVDVASMAANIGIVTLGNLVGGAVFFAAIYWMAFGAKAQS